MFPPERAEDGSPSEGQSRQSRQRLDADAAEGEDLRGDNPGLRSLAKPFHWESAPVSFLRNALEDGTEEAIGEMPVGNHLLNGMA